MKQILTVVKVSVDQHLLDAHDLFLFLSTDLLVDFAVGRLPHVASNVDLQKLSLVDFVGGISLG